MNVEMRAEEELVASTLLQRGQDLMKKIGRFAVDAAKATYKELKDFIIGIWNHAESVIVLTLGSLGVAGLLSELSFWWTLPMWFEAPMVIPVISVIIVVLLMKLAEYRQNRRTPVGA